MPHGPGKSAQTMRENLLGYVNRKQGSSRLPIVTTAQHAGEYQLSFSDPNIADGPPIVIQDPVTGVIPPCPGFDVPVVPGTIS